MDTGVLSTLFAALGLNSALFENVASDPLAYRGAAIAIVVIGSVSTWLGHISVLALNRIGGLRLITSWLLSAVTMYFLQITQALIIWLFANLVAAEQVELQPLVVVALLAFAPLTFSILTAIPHIGLWLGRLLGIWSFLVLFVGVSEVLDISLLRGLTVTLIGYFGMQLLGRVFERPIGAFSSWLWTLMTGRPTMVTAKDVLAGVPIMPINDRSIDAKVDAS